MDIALAHDSFTQMGGAERVVDALHELFPEAPVFTLVFDPKFKEKYETWDIRTSQLQTLYLASGKLQYLLPVIPWGVDNLNFTGFDLVISSSSGFVKNIRVPKDAKHINYCHTPTRFLWSDPNYIKQEVSIFLRPVIKVLLNSMKKWDFSGAQRVTKFVANSHEVQSRIKDYYKRDSDVIYPFIDLDFWKPSHSSVIARSASDEAISPQEKIASAALAMTSAGFEGSIKKDYFLIAGRLQAHKKNDLIIEIFNELGLPLHVVGTGRQEEYLKSIAKPNVTFLGRVSDEQLRDEYSGALGYIFPQNEDFGLMPLEAVACGTATLAYGHGGALETIIPGQTGEFFESYDKEKIKQLILAWDQTKYKAEDLRKQAEKFSKEKFKNAISTLIHSDEKF